MKFPDGRQPTQEELEADYNRLRMNCMVMMGSMVFSHIFLVSCWTACMALTFLSYSSDEEVTTTATAPILAVQTSQMVFAEVGHTRRIVANAFALSFV